MAGLKEAPAPVRESMSRMVDTDIDATARRIGREFADQNGGGDDA